MTTLIRMSPAYVLAIGLASPLATGAGTGDTAVPRFGEVLQVAPIHETVVVKVPEQRCWKRQRSAGAAHDADDGAASWERRCTTVERRKSSREVVAYRVKYRYRGRIYHARTADRPGERIRVDHGFEPVHF